MGGIGQSFCLRGSGLVNILCEWLGLVKLFVVIGGIGQIFCRNGWDKLNFVEVGGVGQTLLEWVGLIKFSVGVSGIGHTFYRCGWDSSDVSSERGDVELKCSVYMSSLQYA